MFPARFVCLLMALACLFMLGTGVYATQVDCDTTYCFTSQDFSLSEEPLTGICITGLPQSSGTVYLGNRILQKGDILTVRQLDQLTFQPLPTGQDARTTVSYLPIYENRVDPAATMTISIRGKTNEPPTAQDSTLETYKNLPNQGRLKSADPEGEALTYTLTRAPRRGDVQLHEDGSFTYTPKKNKVGVDSFTYTAADPAGNLSREATVTIQILKPTDARQYTDTLGTDCRFAAEWLRNTGLFLGESISGESCFYPEKTVSRGEFLAMLVQALDIPHRDAPVSLTDTTPQWLQPYLAAARRAGLMDRLPDLETGEFDLTQPITGAEAAVMTQNALDLSLSQQALQTQSLTFAQEGQADTSWAAAALSILADNGISLCADSALTREDAACMLYQIHQIAPEAPGMAVLRRQQ